MIGRPLSTATRRSRSRKMRCASPPEMSGPIWKIPASTAAIAPTSRSISSQSAMRLATGEPSGVTWVVAREVDRPIRAGAHGLLDRLGHPAQIVLIGALFEPAPAHRIHAQRRMADIHAVIDGLRQALDGRQIFGEGLPGPVDPGHHRLGRDILDRGQATGEPFAVLGLAGRQRKAAIAHHDAGDAMPARAAAERVPGDLRVHMGVAVDKPRGDDQPVGVDRALGGRADAPDLDDAPASRPRHPRDSAASRIRPPPCRS